MTDSTSPRHIVAHRAGFDPIRADVLAVDRDKLTAEVPSDLGRRLRLFVSSYSQSSALLLTRRDEYAVEEYVFPPGQWPIFYVSPYGR